MKKAQMILAKGRERSLLRRHPWIFSGAVKTVTGSPEAGETLEVVDSSGNFLAHAAYSPSSQLTGRVWANLCYAIRYCYGFNGINTPK